MAGTDRSRGAFEGTADNMTGNVETASTADVPAAPAMAQGLGVDKQRLTIWAGIAYALLLPAFVYATAPTTYLGNNSGWLDPFIYTSLIYDYQNLLDRFGGTYYASRIGHIFPGAFFEGVFGAYWGFFIYHWLVLAAASLTAFLFGLRSYSVKVGVFAATIVCATPWLLFSFLSDHYDGFSGAYILMAMMFSLWPSQRQIAIHVAAGLLLAVATNINQFCFPVFGTILPVWAWFHLRQKRKPLHLAMMGVAGMGAFAIGYGLLGLALRASHPVWATATATNDIISFMVSGGAQNWFMSFFGQMDYGYCFYFIGCLFSAILAVWLLKGRAERPINDLALPAIALYALVMAFYFTLQIVFKTGFLAQYFYLVYIFAPSLIVAMAAVGEAERRVSPLTMTIILGAAIGLLIVGHFVTTIKMLQDFHQLGALGSLILALIVLAIFTCLVFLKQKTAAAAVAVLAITASFYWPYQSPTKAMMRDPMSDGWDLKYGVYSLVDKVKELAPVKEGPIGFWYAPKNNNLNSLQSGFLWGYSRVIIGNELPGMPVIDEETITNLLRYNKLMLLGTSSEEVDRGLAALKDFFGQKKTEVDVKERGYYQGKSFRYDYAFVTRDFVDAKAEEFELKDLLFAPALGEGTPLSTSVSYLDTRDGFKMLSTDPANGGYSLTFPLPAAKAGLRVRLHVNVEKGALGSVITKTSDANTWVTAETNTQLGQGVVDFEVQPTEEPVMILLRNGSASGSSEVVIRKVEVYELTASDPVSPRADAAIAPAPPAPAPPPASTTPAPQVAPALPAPN